MTTTQFYCAVCGAGLSVGAESAGRVVECPSCRHTVPVPARLSGAPAAAGCLPLLPAGVLALEIKFLCPACQAKLRTDARLEGETVACPRCERPLQIPRWSGAESGSPAGTSQDPVRLSPAEIEFLSAPAEWRAAS